MSKTSDAVKLVSLNTSNLSLTQKCNLAAQAVGLLSGAGVAVAYNRLRDAKELELMRTRFHEFDLPHLRP
ncbi:MAG: hypothetical protein ABIU85_02245 [Methylotenera sp.]